MRVILLLILLATARSAPPISTSAPAPSPAPALPFLKGADMSFLPLYDCNGTCNQYRRSADAPPTSALAQLATAGLNAVRLRIWNHPAPPVYCDLPNILAMAKRLQQHNLSLVLDFHYSDTWADPGHQTPPAAWSSFSGPQPLAAAVFNYTRHVVAALLAQDTPPLLVQIGNEIDNGMLWAANGRPCDDGGYISKPCTANFPEFAQLVAAGIAGVRAAEATSANPIRVMIHTAKGSAIAKDGPAAVVDWYARLDAACANISSGCPYDAIGLSFYPHWGAGSLDNLLKLSAVKSKFPDKEVMIAETAYPYAGTPPAGAQFPYTEAGQLAFVQTALANTKAGGGSGVFWWGTEIVSGSGAGLTALWDKDYVALPALLQGWS